jgi:hypothetical protein
VFREDPHNWSRTGKSSKCEVDTPVIMRHNSMSSVEIQQNIRRKMSPPSSCLAYTSTLKMETCSSKMHVQSQLTARRYILEDEILHNRRWKNIKTYITAVLFRNLPSMPAISVTCYRLLGLATCFPFSSILPSWAIDALWRFKKTKTNTYI